MPRPEMIRWSEDGAAVELLDPRSLPETPSQLRLESAAEVAQLLRARGVVGQGLREVAAALGFAVELARHRQLAQTAFRHKLEEGYEVLRQTQPGDPGLFRTLERLRRTATRLRGEAPAAVADAVRGEASAVLEEAGAAGRRLGEHGLELLGRRATVLVHGRGWELTDALAPLFAAHDAGRRIRVFVTEGRPTLTGSRVSAWELQRGGVPVAVVTDAAAGLLMAQRRVELVLLGARHVALNGDVAAPIGAYTLAVLAAHHGIPAYAAAPAAAVDPQYATGAALPLGTCEPKQVRRGFGRATAPDSVPVFPPALDVTAAGMLAGLITDRGLFRPPRDAAPAALAGAEPPGRE
jgi:methylthioribose-1-phosphate isomerase